MLLNRLFWLLFALVFLIILYVGLVACALVVPGFGAIVERCPNPPELNVNVADDEGKRLLDEFLSLRVALALAPKCDVADISREEEVATIPTIAPPPVLNKSKEVTFILDTSDSMNYPPELGALPSRDTSLKLLGPLFKEPSSSPSLSLWRYEGCGLPPGNLIKSGEGLRGRSLEQVALFNLGESPLAESILSIPSIIPAGTGLTKEEPANVVIISDGLDGCSGSYVAPELKGQPDINIDDPVSRVCGAVKRVSNQLPGLAIHVVSLFPSNSSKLEQFEKQAACITNETNGWLIDSDDVQSLQSAISRIQKGR